MIQRALYVVTAITSFALWSPAGTFAEEVSSAAGPNVLFISIEDVSPHRFACYGNTVCKTPNIDQLAADGLRFDQAHCTAPPCCPSRTSLLSGLRTHTSGVYGNGDDWSEHLPPGSTMTEHFMAGGYDTIRIGKIYHRGNRGRTYDDSSRWTKTFEGPEGIRKTRPTKRRKLQGPGEESSEGGSPFLYGPSGLADEEEPDGMIATQAIRILSERRDKPLFLAVGFHKPHLAFTAPDKYFDLYPADRMIIPKNPHSDAEGMPLDQAVLRDYNPHTPQQWRAAIAAHYACLTFVDAQVGRLVDALKRTDQYDDTIIVLWSDHGFMLGEHYLWRKGPLFDHSTMVALIIRAPGVTAKASVCKRPVESIDIFPTLFDLCGLSIPDGLEAISMKPLLENPARAWKKGALVTSGKTGFSIVTERWRLTEQTGRPDRTQLYDRLSDPGEFVNLAARPENAETVSSLRRLLRGGWKACLPD